MRLCCRKRREQGTVPIGVFIKMNRMSIWVPFFVIIPIYVIQRKYERKRFASSSLKSESGIIWYHLVKQLLFGIGLGKCSCYTMFINRG